MASFIVKQMVGDQLGAVKSAVGGDEKKEENGGEENEEGLDPEVAEQRRKEEEKRAEKHRKMEAEREEMRTAIRKKYKIEKKEEPVWEPAPGAIGRSARKPGESAPLPGMENKDESMIPKDMDDFKNKMSGLGSGITDKVSEAKDNCTLQ